ncbi:MAG: DUF3892 domain-containing protein [Anaerovoracaceae bacterium]
MRYIDKVHYVIDAHGCEVIETVKWSGELNTAGINECSKKAIIDYINEGNVAKTKTCYSEIWLEGSDIKVVDNKYIKTVANNIKEDNLGNLPRY